MIFFYQVKPVQETLLCVWWCVCNLEIRKKSTKPLLRPGIRCRQSLPVTATVSQIFTIVMFQGFLTKNESRRKAFSLVKHLKQYTKTLIPFLWENRKEFAVVPDLKLINPARLGVMTLSI